MMRAASLSPFAPLLLGVALLLAPCAGCAADSVPLAELPFGQCVCQQGEKGECPVDVCDLQLEVEAATCAGKVELVEIMIGAELERHIWVPGEPARTCATVKRGESFKVVARADTAWAWMPEIACPAQGAADAKTGETISRVLQCVASQK